MAATDVRDLGVTEVANELAKRVRLSACSRAVAEDASDRSMALPFFTGIEASDQELVVEKLREVLAAFS